MQGGEHGVRPRSVGCPVTGLPRRPRYVRGQTWLRPHKTLRTQKFEFQRIVTFRVSRNSLFKFLPTIKKCKKKKKPKNPSLARRSYKKQQVFRAGLQTTVCVPSPPPRPSMATVPIIRTVPLEPSYRHSWNHHSEVRTANPTTPVLPGALLPLRGLRDALRGAAPAPLLLQAHLSLPPSPRPSAKPTPIVCRFHKYVSHILLF